MSFQTNDLNQDTVIIQKKHPYKHSDTPDINEPGAPTSGRDNMLTFDEHMWDHLPEIQQHSQQGSKLLREFSTFCKSYSSALAKFGVDVHKAQDQFQRHISSTSKKGAISSLVDHNYFGYSGKNKKEKSTGKDDPSPREAEDEGQQANHAMSTANEVMKKAMSYVLHQVDEKAALITGDLVEPLELYINHHEQTSQQ